MKSADSRLRVVVAAEWFPPAFRAGGPIRSVANLVEVLGQTHDVFVVAGAYDLGSEEEMPELELNTWVQQPWGQVMFVTRDRWTSRLWHHLLIETLQPDFLYLNSLFARFFALSALRVARKRPAMRVVVAPRGMFGPAALAIKPLKKRAFLWAANAFGWFKDVTWHASTAMEDDEIRRHFPTARIAVAQNIPGRQGDFRQGDQRFKDPTFRFIALGRIHSKKNLEFGVAAVEQALKTMEAPPDVEIQLVGPAEDGDILDRLLAFNAGPSPLRVVHSGALNPLQVEAALQSSHYLLMPTQHENFGHAIVEAWANGCLVLLSDRTPWRGLESLGLGWDLPLDEAAWVRGIQSVLNRAREEWLVDSHQAVKYFDETVRSPEIIEANRRIFSK